MKKLTSISILVKVKLIIIAIALEKARPNSALTKVLSLKMHKLYNFCILKGILSCLSKCINYIFSRKPEKVLGFSKTISKFR